MFDSVISKIAAGVLAVLLLASLVFGGLSYYKWNKTQALYTTEVKANASLTVDLKQAAATTQQDQETIQKLQATLQTDDLLRQSLQHQIDSLKTNQETINANTEKSVTAIDNKYKQLPDTPTNEVAHAQEVSTVRVTSMWETYCLGNHDDPKCRSLAASAAE